MLEVTRFYTRSLDLDRIDLFWEIGNVNAARGAADTDPHPILEYEFFILRAGDSPLGPYEQIGGPFFDTYRFRDVQVSLLHKWRTYHYKLRVRNRYSGEEKDFGPAAYAEPPHDLLAAEIIRNEDILFRGWTGRRCWHFPKRTFGPRCTCWDPTVQRLTRSNHAPCFGTGFLGGYMSPIEVFVQIDPEVRQSVRTSLFELQPGDAPARMISFPLVAPQDILVESENKRWRVLERLPSQRLRADVRQELRLHEVPRGDIEYALPIRIDERTLEPAEKRNFKTPSNLANDADITDTLVTYGPGILRR